MRGVIRGLHVLCIIGIKNVFFCFVTPGDRLWLRALNFPCAPKSRALPLLCYDIIRTHTAAVVVL